MLIKLIGDNKVKKLLIIVSLATSALSFQANAATLSWVGYPPANGTTDGSTPNALFGDYENHIPKGSIKHNWVFSISCAISTYRCGAASDVSVDVQEVTKGGFDDLKVTLDNKDLLSHNSFGGWSFEGLLTPGEHTIGLNGKVNKKAGELDIRVNALAAAIATPIPAAVWLFGSSLLGLFGLAYLRRTAIFGTTY